MELLIVSLALITTVLISFLSFKNRNKRTGNTKVVTLIMLANSSVLISLVLNSMYSILFYALHIIFLFLALWSAIKAARPAKAK